MCIESPRIRNFLSSSSNIVLGRSGSPVSDFGGGPCGVEGWSGSVRGDRGLVRLESWKQGMGPESTRDRPSKAGCETTWVDRWEGG